MVTYTFVDDTVNDADEMNTNFADVEASLQSSIGEIKMVALSMSGATTKEVLQGLGWAVCDGSTSASQGISDATIVTTPDLQNKFIMMSDDETSGTVGTTTSHTHSIAVTSTDTGTNTEQNTARDATFTSTSASNLPPFYELVFFIKVKQI